MYTSTTSQRLVVVLQQQASLNTLEQKLLIDNKTKYALADSSLQLNKLVQLSVYNEFAIAEEQFICIQVSKVKKQRKKIRNASRKRDLFAYFIRTCTNWFNTDEL